MTNMKNKVNSELDSLEKDADYFNPKDNFATNVLATATATGFAPIVTILSNA